MEVGTGKSCPGKPGQKMTWGPGEQVVRDKLGASVKERGLGSLFRKRGSKWREHEMTQDTSACGCAILRKSQPLSEAGKGAGSLRQEQGWVEGSRLHGQHWETESRVPLPASLSLDFGGQWRVGQKTYVLKRAFRLLALGAGLS